MAIDEGAEDEAGAADVEEAQEQARAKRKIKKRGHKRKQSAECAPKARGRPRKQSQLPKEREDLAEVEVRLRSIRASWWRLVLS